MYLDCTNYIRAYVAMTGSIDNLRAVCYQAVVPAFQARNRGKKSLLPCSANVAQVQTGSHSAGRVLPWQVRKAFVETVGEWLVSLHERIDLKGVHDHHHALQLLPISRHCVIVSPWQVRKAFVETVGEWLVALHERIEHQPRLLPYLLGGLCDDIASVRQTSWCWLQRAGGLHAEDHAEDLKASCTNAFDPLVGPHPPMAMRADVGARIPLHHAFL